MKAVMLAAGASTRLYPLTAHLPKCLLPIGGKTILDQQLDALVAAGITQVIIVVGFEKQQIIDRVSASQRPLAITFVHNDAYATTAPILGGLLPAKPYLEGPLIFFHCDVLFGASALSRLLDDKRDSVLLYRKEQWDEEAGKIVVSGENRVVELGKHIEQSRASGEYLQIAKFGNDFCSALLRVLQNRTDENRDGYTIDAFNDVVRSGIEAFALPYEGTALEIDTPQDYDRAQQAWVQ